MHISPRAAPSGCPPIRTFVTSSCVRESLLADSLYDRLFWKNLIQLILASTPVQLNWTVTLFLPSTLPIIIDEIFWIHWRESYILASCLPLLRLCHYRTFIGRRFFTVAKILYSRYLLASFPATSRYFTCTYMHGHMNLLVCMLEDGVLDPCLHVERGHRCVWFAQRHDTNVVTSHCFQPMASSSSW